MWLCMDVDFVVGNIGGDVDGNHEVIGDGLGVGDVDGEGDRKSVV